MNSNLKLEKGLEAYKNGNLETAKEILLSVLQTEQNIVKAIFTLGLILFSEKKYQKAYTYLKQASELTDDPKVLAHYGTVLYRLGKYSEATKQYSAILNQDPNNIGVLNNLCAIKILYGHLSEAFELANRVISIKPDYIDPYINLGNISKDMGNIEESIAFYKKALSIDPSNKIALSNMLLAFHYRSYDNSTIFNEHIKWEQQVPKINIDSKSHPLSLNRKINIGYLSGDFKKHSVSYFIEPILANHNKEEFNIFCYSDVQRPDPVTLKLKGYPVNWRDIYRMYDRDVFSKIQEDKIDILVDLAGHAGNKRLRVFSTGAAPIQITYCGYPDTSGLSNMNYRITDTIADPEGSEMYYTEKLLRMKHSFLCYRPSQKTPQVQPTPAIKNGFTTFGSFNHISKLSDETIKLWAKILQQNKNSRIILKAKQFSDNLTMENFLLKFKKNGVSENRVDLINHTSDHNAHLALYNNIDIALDPFPYNGTTTTCEALWMGVPVITLYGNNHASRVGGTLLTNTGLKSLVVKDKESYFRTAIFLSQNTEQLNSLRLGLRQTFASSPICDGQNFTKELEQLYKMLIKKEMSK